MLDLLRQKLRPLVSDEAKLNHAREFLQVLILKILFDREWFGALAFVGGTALRILHGLRRYSEDLDFILLEKGRFRFSRLLRQVENDLRLYNLSAEIGTEKNTAVNSCFIKFPSLISELGLPLVRKRKLSIKLEIDTHPPVGGKTVVRPVTESFVLAVTSLDLPSLYATKLHACLFRPYTKGRDYYDLIWYLGKRIEPNYPLLNRAIRQTEKKDLHITSSNFRIFLQERLTTVDFAAVRKDVERFLEDKNELKLIDRNLILHMVQP